MPGKKNVPSFQIIGAMDYAMWQSSEIAGSQDQPSPGGWVCQYAIGVVRLNLIEQDRLCHHYRYWDRLSVIVIKVIPFLNLCWVTTHP